MKHLTLAAGTCLAMFAASAMADVAVLPAAAQATSGKAALDSAKARKNGFTPMASKQGGSGVTLAYRIEGTPTVGAPLTIYLSMQSQTDAQVNFTAGPGLVLSNPDQVLASQAGQSAEHSFSVVPQSNGKFYVNVFSSANGRQSASAIPVRVGGGSLQLKSGAAPAVVDGVVVKKMLVP